MTNEMERLLRLASGITEEKVRTAINAERTRRTVWLDLVNRTLDPLIPTVVELSNRIGCPPVQVAVGIMDLKGQHREDGRPATVPCLYVLWHEVSRTQSIKMWLTLSRCLVEVRFGMNDSTQFETTFENIANVDLTAAVIS